MTCQATYYVYETDEAGVLGGRLVAVACTAPRLPSSPWQPARHCRAHTRQLALAAEAGLVVPEPPPAGTAPAAEQAGLL
jgi:hypothetical protein